jgi:hypothetical protein
VSSVDQMIGGQGTGVDRSILCGGLSLGEGRDLAIMLAPSKTVRLGITMFRDPWLLLLLQQWWGRLLLLLKWDWGMMIGVHF